ncbi:hypothetical protein [Tautonia sociabilis]|uniref:Uncharacterized protein n=1 Tax=Tautonia sociabilis TaxID=2080755 RepID=A0A432MFR5_9BACT|nr:hypothetical protein [Tautonia sociabilis]RUL85265.1 hypothetical protein TsocGM_18825 [Tautonia sociabilis]
MPIRVRCQCGQKLKAPDHFAGQRVRCPICKTKVRIPIPDDPEGLPPAPIPIPSPFSDEPTSDPGPSAVESGAFPGEPAAPPDEEGWAAPPPEEAEEFPTAPASVPSPAEGEGESEWRPRESTGDPTTQGWPIPEELRRLGDEVFGTGFAPLPDEAPLPPIAPASEPPPWPEPGPAGSPSRAWPEMPPPADLGDPWEPLPGPGASPAEPASPAEDREAPWPPSTPIAPEPLGPPPGPDPGTGTDDRDTLLPAVEPDRGEALGIEPPPPGNVADANANANANADAEEAGATIIGPAPFPHPPWVPEAEEEPRPDPGSRTPEGFFSDPEGPTQYDPTLSPAEPEGIEDRSPGVEPSPAAERPPAEESQPTGPTLVASPGPDPEGPTAFEPTAEGPTADPLETDETFVQPPPVPPEPDPSPDPDPDPEPDPGHREDPPTMGMAGVSAAWESLPVEFEPADSPTGENEADRRTPEAAPDSAPGPEFDSGWSPMGASEWEVEAPPTELGDEPAAVGPAISPGAIPGVPGRPGPGAVLPEGQDETVEFPSPFREELVVTVPRPRPRPSPAPPEGGRPAPTASEKAPLPRRPGLQRRAEARASRRRRRAAGWTVLALGALLAGSSAVFGLIRGNATGSTGPEEAVGKTSRPGGKGAGGPASVSASGSSRVGSLPEPIVTGRPAGPEPARFEAPPEPRPATVAELLGPNLVLNPGAERFTPLDDATSPSGSVDFEGWERLGFVAARSLAEDPIQPIAVGAPPDLGAFSFLGGLPEDRDGVRTLLRQAVDVSVLADRIDAGRIRVEASAWLGGRDQTRSFSPNDRSTFTVRFLDANGDERPGTAMTLGPIDDGMLQSGPPDLPLMAPVSGAGPVPAGTRALVFELAFDLRAGAVIDASADDLLVSLSEAP